MRIDFLHLIRSLRRSPASAAAAVLTLSVTLGAGASIFAVVDAVLLTPPPFADPAALVTVGETAADEPDARPRPVTYSTFTAWRDRASALAAVEAFDGTNLTLTDLGAAERLSVNDTTPGFLPLLGIAPARGRAFGEGDVGGRVVMVSHAFWRDKLALDAGVVGRQLMLGNQAYTVVGVLPESFVFALNKAAIWRPLPVTAAQAALSGYRVSVVARLSSGVSALDLQTALDEVSRQTPGQLRAVATPIATAITGDAPRTLGLLAGAAALAVLIAFANLAGLLTVRAIDRRRELALRSALGARRSEITRLLLFEAQALVVMGTIGGIVLAYWLTPIVGRLALEQFGDLAQRQWTLSWRVIAVVALLASVLAGICGLLPAIAATRRNVVDLLRRGSTGSPHDLLFRRLCVAGEIALAFVLLISVMLLGRSLMSALAINPGFDARNVMVLQVSLPRASYATPERTASFYAALQRRLQERPGTEEMSIVDELPLTGSGGGRSIVGLRQTDTGRESVVRAAGPGYFAVMRIRTVAGRTFAWTDDAAVMPRVVVSESLAARVFGSEPAVGRRVWIASIAQFAGVIGVVGDVKHRALDETPLPTAYLSALQAPSNSSIVVVRSGLPEADVIRAVRDEVGRLDRGLPVYGVSAMREIVARSPGVPERRVLTAAFAGFSLLGLLLGGIGLFGVVAHDVASRRSEFALRMALGADPLRIVQAIAGQGATIVVAGLVAGGVLSIWTSRALAGAVFATDRLDVLTVGVPAVVLLVAGMLAVLPAARRASHTDPLLALRSE